MTSLRLATLNTDWATGAKKDGPVLEWLAARADVLFIQEAKNLWLAQLFGTLHLVGWHVAQSVSSAARRGTALIWKPKVSRFAGIGLWLGGDSKVTLRRWMTRGLTRVGVTSVLCMSVHIFPKRSKRKAQMRYLRKVKARTDRAHRHGRQWAVGADWNMPIDEVAKFLNGTAYGTDRITGFVCSKGLKVTGVRTTRHPMSVGETDHPATFITIHGETAA